ncbi:amino acid racemase [Mesorhizobium sp. M1005]|uniref:aspartate/glutamate racemase family protein n=1 Tax=unclassified Mesorhizobium TaxID=325217 RepID=UPI0033356ACC
MSIIPMGLSMPDWESGDLAAIRQRLANSASRLSAAGCDYFVCPDNTAHLALETNGPDLELPGLHIADVVASEASRLGYRKLGILGTKWIMTKPMYFSAAKARGLDAIAPGENDQKFINETIFSELCNGVFADNTRAHYVEIIERLKSQGCDAVVLGCTEIPALISPAQSPLPTLDSTRLLAQHALDVALGGKELPTWRGGPF